MIGGREAWVPARGEPVVVYGAGSFARDALRAVRDRGADVRGILDQRAREIRNIDGYPVSSLGEEPLSSSDRARTTAIVGVFNRDADARMIERALAERGYGRVVSVPELYESFASELGERFWLARRREYDTHTDRIARAAELWGDEASRALYGALLRYRLGWSAADFPLPGGGDQYFPDDLPSLDQPIRFVDCGAFIGDTLAEAHRRGEPMSDVYAFEPDPSNFERLAAYAREVGAQTGIRLSLWPCAVSDRSGRMSFAGAAGEASRLSDNGADVVAAIALDDALPTADVSYVKMDIEGAEPAALRGGQRLIARCRPRLAICVYHRAEHLWEIPLQVDALGLSYDLYLRSHGHYGFDVVMYAVPRDGA